MNAVLEDPEVEDTEVGGDDTGECDSDCVDCCDEPVTSVVFLEYHPFVTVVTHPDGESEDGTDANELALDFVEEICGGVNAVIEEEASGQPHVGIHSVDINPTPELIEELYEQLDERLRGTGICVVILPVGSHIAAISNKKQ